MPNTFLFPSDFTNAVSNAQSSGASALDTSVKNLQTDARLSALRQVQARRVLGQQTSALQNSLVMTLVAKPTRMPLHQVGKLQPPPSMLGTVGYFVAGQDSQQCVSMERLLFSGEALSLISVRLTTQRHFPAVVGNQKSFYTAGGWEGSSPGRVTSSLNKTSFLDESTVRIASSLSVPTYHAVGVGNAFSGYYFGGVAQWISAYRKIEKITYSTETTNVLSTQLVTGRVGGMGTAGSASAGYLFGGDTVNFGTWSGLTSIEKFLYSGETISVISATMPRIQGHAAIAGNSNAAYICGGWLEVAAPYVASNPIMYRNNTAISRFYYVNETTGLLGISMTAARHCTAALSSNKSLYVGGGWLPDSVWPIASRDIDKIDISTIFSETIYRLGVNLINNRAEHVGISDYAAGYIT